MAFSFVQEDGSEVFAVRLRVRGNPGTVHLHIKDSAGQEGTSKLTADCLDVVLEAGPPTCLIFDGPNLLHREGLHRRRSAWVWEAM